VPIFTNHLRKECELLQRGAELLDVYGTDLQQDKDVAIEDLRMAVYVMLVTLETGHLQKEETLLYPALLGGSAEKNLSAEMRAKLESCIGQHEKIRLALESFRMSIDGYEHDQAKKSLVRWHLEDFVEAMRLQLKEETSTVFAMADKTLTSSEQKTLYDEAQKFESNRGAERAQGTRIILSRLRRARGLSAA
jgi:hemerythrin-like domain-containing protein